MDANSVKKMYADICSIGSSNKDFTQIGTFGIGFKAVYNYTDFPEIYSGDERFRIRDLTKPEGIDDIDARITEQVEKGRTVFRLPFRDKLRQKDIVLLKNRLCNLEKRACYSCVISKRFNGVMSATAKRVLIPVTAVLMTRFRTHSEVELIASMNGDNQPSETFLVFRKEVQPPQEVIDELLQQGRKMMKNAIVFNGQQKQQQPVEVAFKLSDGRITVP